MRTAGLGRDAFLLASLGAEVTLIERAPSVHALLADAIAALAAAEPAIAARMRLVAGDARELLPTLEADVVTVDPMHPARVGSALVKAEMRRLRGLVGRRSRFRFPDRRRARRQRARAWWSNGRCAPPLPLGLPAPSHALTGKTVRYDVFARARPA